MTPKISELIAVGASVAGHCQSCLSNCLGKARELGISEKDVKEAMELVMKIGRAGDNRMAESAGKLPEGERGK